jgi:hypothetical protein
VYAPGVQGYKPMVLDLESSEDAEFMPAIYPKPKILYLPAIKERVPVFEGKFRIAADAKIAATPQFMKLLGANGKSIAIAGQLHYQAATKRRAIFQHRYR